MCVLLSLLHYVLGEQVFKTWTSSRIDKWSHPAYVINQNRFDRDRRINFFLLKASCDLFGIGSIPTESEKRIDNSLLVTLEVKNIPISEGRRHILLGSWNRLRLCWMLFRYPSSSHQKQYITKPNGDLQFNGYLVYFPRILLHSRANHKDAFRGLFIANALKHEFDKSNHFIMSNNDSSEENIAKQISQKIKDAYDYEEINRDAIDKLLREFGWDMEKFMYGEMKIRVEW